MTSKRRLGESQMIPPTQPAGEEISGATYTHFLSKVQQIVSEIGGRLFLKKVPQFAAIENYLYWWCCWLPPCSFLLGIQSPEG